MKNYILVTKSYTKDSEKEKKIVIKSFVISTLTAMDQQRRRRDETTRVVTPAAEKTQAHVEVAHKRCSIGALPQIGRAHV